MKKLLTAAFCVAVLTAYAAPAPGGIRPGPQGPETDPTITHGTAARDLGRAITKWKAADVVVYRMRINRGCFCAPPSVVTLRVRNGKVVRKSSSKWLGPRTVGGMFRVVGDAINGGAASLDVTYDRRLGFPRSIAIDNIAAAIDDEIGYEVKLTPLR